MRPSISHNHDHRLTTLFTSYGTKTTYLRYCGNKPIYHSYSFLVKKSYNDDRRNGGILYNRSYSGG